MRIVPPHPTAPSDDFSARPEDSPASAEGGATADSNVVAGSLVANDAAAPAPVPAPAPVNVAPGVGVSEVAPRPSLQQSHTNLVGTVLADRYRLLKLIGEGGMGSVYQAEHITIGRKLAIKVLAPEFCDTPEIVARFLQEARTASMLHHEHIVDITDFGYTKQGLAFLTMEYLEGEDLATLLAREGRQPWSRVRRMILQVCRALDAAHDKGIVHRDMKPDNCFRIKRGGNPDFIKILDFGIAKVIVDGQNPNRADRPKMATEAGTLLGTPEYMAPEIARDQKADARVDVYSVGVVMYELLTGSVPFKGQTFMATVAMQMVDEPDPPRKRAPEAMIPEEIEQVVLKALRKDPNERFQTIREFAQAIIDADKALRYTSQGMPALAWEADDYAPPPAGEPSAMTLPPGEPSVRLPVQGLTTSGSVPVQQLRPATTQLPTVTEQPREPQVEDEPSYFPRSNPYRVLTVLLLLVVAGLGGFVYYLLTREPPAPLPTETKEPQTIVTPPVPEQPDDKKADDKKPDDKKGEEPKEPKKGDKHDKGDDHEKTKKSSPASNVPTTEEETSEFFGALAGDVRRCAGLHDVAGGTVRVSVSVEAGTGKLNVDMRSHKDNSAFSDCVTKAFEKKRFKRGRQAFIYNGDYGL